MCIRDRGMGNPARTVTGAENVSFPEQTHTEVVTSPQSFGAVYEFPVSYTHLRAHETVLDLVCRLLLEKKKASITPPI